MQWSYGNGYFLKKNLQKNDNTFLLSWIYNRLFTVLDKAWPRSTIYDADVLHSVWTTFSMCMRSKHNMYLSKIKQTPCQFFQRKNQLFLYIVGFFISFFFKHTSTTECSSYMFNIDASIRKKLTVTLTSDIYDPVGNEERSKLIWRLNDFYEFMSVSTSTRLSLD